MDNETVKKMKAYEIKMDDFKKQELIHLGKQKMLKHQLYKHSLLDFFLSSIRFTRIHTWLIQFSILVLTAFLITRVINDELPIFIIQSLTIAVIFSAIFFIDELFRSFTFGMWELEQTLKYDLRQHTIIKLLIFGLTDLLLIIILAFICHGVMAISFWKIILYLLVPFNITCIVLFSLFTMWRNTLSSVIFWMGSGIVLMCVMILANVFHIYELTTMHWVAGYILSILFLGIIVMNMLKVKKWEALC